MFTVSVSLTTTYFTRLILLLVVLVVLSKFGNAIDPRWRQLSDNPPIYILDDSEEALEMIRYVEKKCGS